jgi:hypothetical protein
MVGVFLGQWEGGGDGGSQGRLRRRRGGWGGFGCRLLLFSVRGGSFWREREEMQYFLLLRRELLHGIGLRPLLLRFGL